MAGGSRDIDEVREGELAGWLANQRVQIAKLVRAADDDWQRAILLGYYTGARLSDVANMRWRAIDWSNKIISAPMFPSLAGKGTGGKHGLSGRFVAVMEKAGIQGKRTQASGGRRLSSLSFHSLRHSFNSALANAGVSQEIRQKLTGHTSAEMNTIYTHHDLAPLRAAVEKLPSLGIK